MQLIPAIDIQDGRCVRLRQGRFDTTRIYNDDVIAQAQSYFVQGADWLHIVDLDAAQGDGIDNLPLVRKLASDVPASLQMGGGLRETAQLEALFDAGVQRLVVGSRAVTHAEAVREWLQRFGGERVVAAFDVRLDDGEPIVRTHGWQRSGGITLWQALEAYADSGLRHVLCTDVARDGMAEGPNLDLYRQCVRRFPTLAWQASGGIRSRADLKDVADIGMAAAISGRALLERAFTFGEASTC